MVNSVFTDVSGVEKVSIPFVVLTKDDGMRLLDTIQRHSGTILARLDAESAVDAMVNLDEDKPSMKKSGKKGV